MSRPMLELQHREVVHAAHEFDPRHRDGAITIGYRAA